MTIFIYNMLYHNLHDPVVASPNKRLLSAKSTLTNIPCLGSREQRTLHRDPVNQNTLNLCLGMF